MLPEQLYVQYARRCGSIRQKKHITILNLISVRFEIFSCIRKRSAKAIHWQRNNDRKWKWHPYKLSSENGGTRNQELMNVSKKIWDYLLNNQIIFTVEFLTNRLNMQTNWQFRNLKSPYKQKSNLQIFC